MTNPNNDDGLFWVVLGGRADIVGIHADERPVNTALGNFPSLQPIVVATKTYSDALVVDGLRASLERKAIDRNDYLALREFFMSNDVRELLMSNDVRELLSKYEKFYAIRVGKETGIWVDYTWDEIAHLKKFTDAKWKGHPTLQDALLWMIEKAPHNRPPRKTPGPNTVPSKPAVVSEDRGKLPAPVFVTSRPSVTGSDTPLPPVIFAHGSHRGGSPFKADRAPDVPTAAMRSLSVSSSPALQLLQDVIRPLASQVPNVAGLSAFNLGSRANAFLRGRDAGDAIILKLLRARLYAESCEDFAHFVSVELNWKDSDSKELWKLIDIPGI